MIDIEIELLDLVAFDHNLNELAGVLHACVHSGASVSFILPFGIEDSKAFWLISDPLPGIVESCRSIKLAVKIVLKKLGAKLFSSKK